KDDWHTLSTGLETRINDNFQILKSAI
ncbi:MAG: hypothetical protein ACI8ZF_000755, partial [Candidatus Midichloriaceae bacterium]